MEIGYTIYRMLPTIFAVEIPDKYDLGMLFCRFQEFYESPEERFRQHPFSMNEYMRWYAHEASFQKCFSYPSDWNGYNIPSPEIKKCFNAQIPDFNCYDLTMAEIYHICRAATKGKPFYIIGVTDIEGEDSRHELAHGIFWSDEEYRQAITNLVDNIPINNREDIERALTGIGYDKSVFVDELQAYLSDAEIVDQLASLELEELSPPFRELLDKYLATMCAVKIYDSVPNNQSSCVSLPDAQGDFDLLGV